MFFKFFLNFIEMGFNSIQDIRFDSVKPGFDLALDIRFDSVEPRFDRFLIKFLKGISQVFFGNRLHIRPLISVTYGANISTILISGQL